MAFINASLLLRLPPNRRNKLVYHPDVILFQHSRPEQYAAQWKVLAQSKYLYTNGYDVMPTNWFGYAWQKVRGWFGYPNLCQPERVQFTLEKYAFSGYLSSFSQEPLAQQNPKYPLSPEFLALVSQPRSSETSHKIHQHLIDNYVTHARDFVPGDHTVTVTNHHRFGDTWRDLRFWVEIPRLDPQNSQLIAETLQNLEGDVNSDSYPLFKPSTYATEASEFYWQKALTAKKNNTSRSPTNWFNDPKKQVMAYLAKAESFDAEICNKDLITFIDYYLDKSNFQGAFTLLMKLNRQETTLQYLLTRFKRSQYLEFVTKDSALALALVKELVKTDPSMETYKFVKQLDSNFAEHYPAEEFLLLVDAKQYEEAYKWFKAKSGTTKFTEAECKEVAAHYRQEEEKLYKEGLVLRNAEQWEKAELVCLQGINAHQKANLLDPSSADEMRGYGLQKIYAHTVIQKIVNHSNSTTAEDIVKLQKAMALLGKCCKVLIHKDEQELIKADFAYGLMYQVNHLMEHIKVSSSYNDDIDERKQHKAKHEAKFDEITKMLEQVITLLAKTNEPKLKALLAKAHYLLGDMKMFFDRSEDYVADFKQAMDLVPNNPYYLLRYAEKILTVKEKESRKLRAKGLSILKDLGFEEFEYDHWDENRWFKTEYNFLHTVRNIHDIQPKEASFFSRLTSMF